MSDGKFINMKTCAVTGQRYEAGDYVIQAAFGVYVVKATVDYTSELREATEAELQKSIPTINAAVALTIDAVAEAVKRSRTARVEPTEGDTP